MSQLLHISVPLHLACYRVPARWQHAENGTCYSCTVEQQYLSSVDEPRPHRFTEFDPWDMRLEFLRVQLHEPEDLIQFLNKVGLFEPVNSRFDESGIVAMQGEAGPCQVSYDPLRTWNVDDFLPLHEFCRDWPINLRESSAATLPLRVVPVKERTTEKSEKPEMQSHLFIATGTFYEAIHAIFAVDQIMSGRRMKCQRPDCGNTFAVVGNRKRLYCSEACGHYMAVKASRERHAQGKGTTKL